MQIRGAISEMTGIKERINTERTLAQIPSWRNKVDGLKSEVVASLEWSVLDMQCKIIDQEVKADLSWEMQQLNIGCKNRFT